MKVELNEFPFVTLVPNPTGDVVPATGDQRRYYVKEDGFWYYKGVDGVEVQSQGLQGPPGVDGVDGADGPAGAVGPAGATGAAAADALDLAAGVGVRDVIASVARVATSDTADYYLNSGVFTTALNRVLASPGLRLFASLAYDYPGAGPLGILEVPGANISPLNLTDAVLAALVANGNAGMTIDLRGNIPPTLDVPASFAGPLLVTCAAVSGGATDGDGFANFNFTIPDPTDSTLQVQYVVTLVVGPEATTVSSGSNSRTIAVPAGTSEAGVATIVSGEFGNSSVSGDTVTIAVAGPGGFSVGFGNVALDISGVVDTPAASSLVITLQSRGCTLRYDGDGL